ncbi:unnamed protein product [Cuscuta europaea]|uniref:DUF4283 domain-containing protein n=1 Tax=Cuscuta europaea TaxID=41803 RepID=A0A9P0ZLD4_CUSEU|nr:unnamed protein product [Cuscuta europaea]
MVVGRLLTDKPIRFPFFRDSMADIWRPGRGVNIRDLGDRRYLFQFFHEVDFERILQDGPWAFENNLLILRRLGMSDNPKTQVYDVPSFFFTEHVAMIIGNHIGSFDQADQNNYKGMEGIHAGSSAIGHHAVTQTVHDA